MWPFRLGKKLATNYPNQRQEGARAALIILFLMNVLNTADRYVPSAVKGLLKKDLHLSDTQTALPATCMVIVYMISALLFGWIVDMRIFDRRAVLASGVAFWSLATALAGFARSFTELLVFRSLIGVGEAAFITIVFPLLADYYPIADRNLAYMVFGIGGPLGGAVGFIIGSVVGGAVGWRVAFFVCGIPGLIIAGFVLTLNDPSPGINDPKSMQEGLQQSTGIEASEAGEQRARSARRNPLTDVRDIFSVPHWCVSVIGMVAVTFTIGGLADWYDYYLLKNVPGMTMGKVGMALGACTMIGGISGTFIGSKTAQAVSKSWRNAYLLVPALFMIPSGVFIFLCINVTINQYLSFLFALLAWVHFFTHTAPLNTVMYNSMPVHLRSRAGALSVLFTHVLGDVISPPIIGAISDGTGSLRLGMQLCWIMPVVALLAWGIGAAFLPPLPEASDDTSHKVVKAAEKDAPPSLWSLLFEGEETMEEVPSPSKLAATKYGSA